MEFDYPEISEDVISEDAAKEQLYLLLKAYGIDARKQKQKDPESFKSTEKFYKLIVENIMAGRMSIEENNDGTVDIVQHFKNEIEGYKDLRYKHLTAMHIIASEREESYSFQRSALLSSMSQSKTRLFENMIVDDDYMCSEIIFSFFRSRFIS